MLSKACPKNENVADRVVRALLGGTLLSLVFVGPRTPWGWIGTILLVTALVGSCPLYTLLRVSTRAGKPAT